MANKPYVGMGKNPNPSMPDMPMGLGMALMQNQEAMQYYGTLNGDEQKRVIGYVQSCHSGDEAMARIQKTVQGLQKHSTSFT